jgi:hypothetical protein
VEGERPEPPQMIGTASHLIDAADAPLSGVDGVILPVLVDPGTEAGRAEPSVRSPAYDPGYRPNCRPNDPFAETEGASDYAHALIEARVCLHQEREDCAYCVSQ